MKGQLWDIMVIILTFGFLIFIVNTAFGAIGESVRISAIINSEEVVDLINVLQSSPVETKQTYFLPQGECSLIIKSYSDLVVINFTSTYFGTKHTGITEPLATDISIDDLSVDCDKNSEKKIYFKRCSDAVKISDVNEIAC